jgi:hypothetical protein
MKAISKCACRAFGGRDGKVALIEPDWVGKLAGFTLLSEALVLMLAQQMPIAAVARNVGES